jgi:hypothetical protein
VAIRRLRFGGREANNVEKLPKLPETSKRTFIGYRVLDFTPVLGTTTTRWIAEIGAEIIKVEFAPNGDISPGIPYPARRANPKMTTHPHRATCQPGIWAHERRFSAHYGAGRFMGYESFASECHYG